MTGICQLLTMVNCVYSMLRLIVSRYHWYSEQQPLAFQRPSLCILAFEFNKQQINSGITKLKYNDSNNTILDSCLLRAKSTLYTQIAADIFCQLQTSSLTAIYLKIERRTLHSFLRRGI